MNTVSTCAAKDPATCRYHGMILKRDQAQRDGDVDAYLFYAQRVQEREKMANPEEFFAPNLEVEDIASVKQLHALFHSTSAEQLPKAYRAEVTYGSTFRGRYRKYAKKNKLAFTEKHVSDGSVFVFDIRTRHDIKVLADMIAHGQDVLKDMDAQAVDVAHKR